MRAGLNQPKTVLLVEDYADSRYMMRRLLEMDGYRVVEAADGREECAERECPDLILMDLGLPRLDGLSATRLIRRLGKLCDVPIVALTAHDASDLHAKAVAAGCDEFVTKPVNFDQLEGVVRRFCHAP